MLDIQNITIQYGTADPAVQSLSLQLQRGEILGIVGESGSGKTSVLRAVHGTLPGKGRVTQGDIRFEGSSVLSCTSDQWRQIRGTQMSMIFQNTGAMMNPIRTVGSQFAEYIRAHSNLSRKDAWDRGLEMLRSVHLPDADRVMKSYPFELSGGMLQRVGIAMAVTFRPKLLLADEPTSALDVIMQARIAKQMLQLREEYDAGLIVITHNVALAAYMSDKLLILKNGRAVEQGSRRQILQHPQSAYTKHLLASVPSMGGICDV